jgi:hypothetical protein
MENIRSCCVPKAERSPSESIELLNSTVFALDIRCKALFYRCKEHMLRAKKYKEEGDMIRCKAELLLRFQLLETYQKYVNLHSNVCRVRDSLEEASAVGAIAGNMHIANRALEEALKSVNPEKIDELMQQLEEGTQQMHEVTTILGENRGVEEFDEEAALEELEEELPSVPYREETPTKKKLLVPA